MTVKSLWPVVNQFQNKNGSILTSGRIYVYYKNRTALAEIFSDEEGTIVIPNPVLLDNNGRATVFADTAYSYTIVVCDYYGKELFSQNITLHDVTESADEITLIGSDGSIHIDTSSSNGVKTFDMSANTDILATKKSVDDVKTDLNTLTGTVNNHTTQIEGIESTVANKKDKQNELNFNGSATKTVKSITQNANGELNVEFENIDLPQEVPNVEITSEDNSVKVTETTDTQTNTKKFDLSVNVDDKIPDPSTSNPLMDGTASVGSSSKYAREDHIHPTDTSREAIDNKTTVVLGTSNSKYPTDKAVADFVNSSVATNTANYISNNGEPFTSVEELEAYTGTVTNNDYAFVTGTDSAGNTYYDRYKATVSGSTVTWALEYRLNNSSFTAAQWAAINSGVTSDKANYWDGKQDALTAGDNVTIVDNVISSNQVFVATYGTTKYADVKAAYDAGKICTVFKDKRYYYVIRLVSNYIRFVSSDGNDTLYSLTVSSADIWTESTSKLQSNLTFDTTPTAGSSNPVTSNGIRTMKPLSHRFDNESSSRLIVWGKANGEGYIHDIVRKFGLKYGAMTDFLFATSVHKDNTTSVSINILNASSRPLKSTKRLKASIFKDSSENSYFALWLDGSISQPGTALYADYYPDVSEEESYVRHFTVFNPSEYTLVRDLTIKYRPLALPTQSVGVLTSDGTSNWWLTPPASGNAVLKSVNGVIQWVTE